MNGAVAVAYQEMSDPFHVMDGLTVTRQKDATAINAFVNHPDIYPFVKGNLEGYIDLSKIIASGHPVLCGEFGGVIMVRLQPGIYEVHTAIMPAARGSWGNRMFRDALHFMFCTTDAVEIMTRVPQDNPSAAAATKFVGFKSEWTVENGWPGMKGGRVNVDVWSMKIQDWMRRESRLRQIGEWFHSTLNAIYASTGKPIVTHSQEAIHDQYVGAAVALTVGGRPDMAVYFYNRWASLSGFSPIKLMSTAPITIDIVESKIVFTNGKLEVV